MFSNIKFNSSVAPVDHNGHELEIGNAVMVSTPHGYYATEIGIIMGITKNEKYLWIGDGTYMYKRMPKNVILISDPKAWLNEHK